MRRSINLSKNDLPQSTSNSVRIIGDVHGQVDEVIGLDKQDYLTLTSSCECSVQLGDMGDGQSYRELESNGISPIAHRFFPGNHDHYNCLPQHSVGDYGNLTLGDVSLFYIRGAASSDKQKLLKTGKQIGRQLWFEEEELTEQKMSLAAEEYTKFAPKIILSHEAPSRIGNFLKSDSSIRSHTKFQPSRTSEFLESLLEIHRPKLWAFGHYHRDWQCTEEGTTFRCVGELSYIDIDQEGKIVAASNRAIQFS